MGLRRNNPTEDLLTSYCGSSSSAWVEDWVPRFSMTIYVFDLFSCLFVCSWFFQNSPSYGCIGDIVYHLCNVSALVQHITCIFTGLSDSFSLVPYISLLWLFSFLILLKCIFSAQHGKPPSFPMMHEENTLQSCCVPRKSSCLLFSYQSVHSYVLYWGISASHIWLP